MATTDARSGFRLPWSSDRQTETESEAAADATAEAAAADPTWSGDPSPAVSDAQTVSSPDATQDVATESSADEVVAEAVPASTVTESPASPAPAAMDPVARPPSRKPNKFLADLTKAMQAAAEEARGRSLAQLQADAKTHVESIHGRSSTEAAGLRRAADDDVAAIREWSKAEIARIREETEVRITDRKSQLETEIDDHAGVIEREIDAVQRMVASFEEEMASFFERLLGEDDPTRFATMAENLPEPPTFEDISAVVGHPVEQPSSTTPEATEVEAATDPIESDSVSDAVAETSVNEPVEAESSVAADAEAGDAEVNAEGEIDPTAGADSVEGSAESVESTSETTGWSAEDGFGGSANGADGTPDGELDREAASAGIQAAAEAAASAEIASDAAERAEAASDVAIEVMGSHDEGEDPDADPRVAALGLSPDYDAAEAEARAAADTDDAEEIPTIDDGALATRLADLVPAGESEAAAETETKSTQVIVVGLVSVASIASFKRHLGRVPGVQSVGVSSGPDGEFVFAVSHASDSNLRDVIPSLPSFQARVTSSAEGAIHVTAHDPETDG